MIEPKNNGGKMLHTSNEHRITELGAELKSDSTCSENFGYDSFRGEGCAKSVPRGRRWTNTKPNGNIYLSFGLTDALAP